MTESDIFKQIAQDLSLSTKQIATVDQFLSDGATVPFLARYRKEATGGLDEEVIRLIRDALATKRALEERRSFILSSIEKQEKLTPELKEKILKATDLTQLEDLYLPYKPKRKTRAGTAREKGLEPLATLMWHQELVSGSVEELVSPFLNEELGVTTQEEAIKGACDIMAEWISEHIKVREELRKLFRKSGVMHSKKVSSVTERTVFENYYEFKCPVKYLKPYQTLALNRGERESILSVSLEMDNEHALDTIDYYILKEEDTLFTEEILQAIDDAYKRLLFPSLERELRSELSKIADEHAISIFATNVGNLLMQPPLKGTRVMGIDPAFRTGCKVAVVDEFGNYLEGTTIFPVPPHNRVEESEKVIAALIARHDVSLIAIGNGTASRETEQFIAHFIQQWKEVKPEHTLNYLITNEAGASVYSASPLAKQEFPSLDAAMRGNISIARRVQDPLAELVKIDPKSIGVGLYQHDVNQVELMKSLDDVVETCVNSVGVNVNTASTALLNHVSGITSKVAENIISFRAEKGPFSSRKELMDVPSMGPFRFEQAAGFLRIPESNDPLDNTAIHPESYDATRKLCSIFDIDLTNIAGESDKIARLLKKGNLTEVASQIGVGVPTLSLILENLLKPGRDPRESLPKPILRSDILKIEDLVQGQVLEGTVRNVVDFGAFVDIGVKEDGLLHISKMTTHGKKVDNPTEIMAVGDIIKVSIESVDIERGRIALALG